MLAAFHEGKRYDHVAAFGTEKMRDSVRKKNPIFPEYLYLLLEWTHGGSGTIYMVWIYPSFWKVPRRRQKERRIRRNRDENAASPFICRVVELEQEKLEVQRKNAGLIVGKEGSVYEQ